MPGEKGAKSR